MQDAKYSQFAALLQESRNSQNIILPGLIFIYFIEIFIEGLRNQACAHKKSGWNIIQPLYN
jgi:hypothetical protein